MPDEPAARRRRTLWVPDDEWEPAATKARQHGTTMSAVIRDMIRNYGKSKR